MKGVSQQSRWWVAGGALVAVLLAAASWLMLIGPKLDDADSVRQQTQSANDQNSILQIKVDKLRADSASMPDLLHQLDALHAQLPTTSGLDDLTRQLTGDAQKADVTLTSIVIGAPTVVKGSTAAAPTAAGDDSETVDTDQPDPPATQDATTTAAAPPASSSSGNLYAIPVTVAANGALAGQLALLDAIHAQGSRGALVSSVQFAPAPEVADQAGGVPADAPSSGATGTGAAPSTSAATSNGGDATSAPSGAERSSSDDAPAGEPVPVSAVTMTVQLAVFVAPQTPQDEAALRQQLGG